MSFILDALKKSQATRQRHAGPGTIAVETAPRSAQPHNWWAMVIVIVVINLVVVLGFIYWTSRDKAAVGMQPESRLNTEDSGQAGRQGQDTAVASARPTQPQNMPARGEVSPLSAEVKEARSETRAAPQARVVPAQESEGNAGTPSVILPPPAPDSGFLPTLTELRLENRIALAPMHVDVHVYNEDPRRRFVLVNTRKYKEGERLSEGPLLETIRRDGLVMYYRGQRFLVPRE